MGSFPRGTPRRPKPGFAAVYCACAHGVIGGIALWFKLKPFVPNPQTPDKSRGPKVSAFAFWAAAASSSLERQGLRGSRVGRADCGGPIAESVKARAAPIEPMRRLRI